MEIASFFEAGVQIYKAAFEEGAVDTSTVLRLSPPGRFFDPDWSPSGRQVAYPNSIGDTSGIWISPVDGSRSKEYFVQGGMPQWFQDGLRLLYTCNGLCTRQVDLSSHQRIFSFPENGEFHTLRGAAVSADGSNKEQLTTWPEDPTGSEYS